MEVTGTLTYEMDSFNGGGTDRFTTVDIDVAVPVFFLARGTKEVGRKLVVEVDYALPTWSSQFDYYAQASINPLEGNHNLKTFVRLSKDSVWTFGLSYKF